MKVKQAIELLKNMDQDAELVHLWDGECRTSIEHIYMGKTGNCVTADCEMVAYSEAARPIDAPSPKEDRYWQTPTPHARFKR